MNLRSTVPLLRRCRRPLLPDEDGASAVEFALLAPILVLACIATIDVGLAISQRMHIDQSLRAGAAAAMLDPDGLTADDVRDYVEGSASGSFTIAPEAGAGEIDTSSDTDLSVTVEKLIACPESVSAKVRYGSVLSCADDADPYVYFRLTGETRYDPMLLWDQFPLEGIPLEGSILVQVE